MFRWCAYCQHLMGETPPLNRYQVSHGICEPCSRNPGVYTSGQSLLRAAAIFEQLVEAGQRGKFEDCEQAINDGLEFGLGASEIIVGVLHPALYRIGELWEAGEITVAEEHRFTDFALQLIDRLEFPEPLSGRPLIVLANHPESRHEIGPRTLQLLSWERGIPCKRVPVGTPESELLDVATALSPNTFGLSVSLVEFIPSAIELAERLSDLLPDTSEVVLGGQAFRRTSNHHLPQSITVLKTIDDFQAHLDKLTPPGRKLPDQERRHDLGRGRGRGQAS